LTKIARFPNYLIAWLCIAAVLDIVAVVEEPKECFAAEWIGQTTVTAAPTTQAQLPNTFQQHIIQLIVLFCLLQAWLGTVVWTGDIARKCRPALGSSPEGSDAAAEDADAPQIVGKPVQENPSLAVANMGKVVDGEDGFQVPSCAAGMVAMGMPVNGAGDKGCCADNVD